MSHEEEDNISQTLEGKFAQKVLEDKAVQDMTDIGLRLRNRAETQGTRQAIAQKLLDAMTPEAQAQFIKDTQGFAHMIKEGVMGQFTLGLRSLWKAAAPSILKRRMGGTGNFRPR
ncbi:hypothetical protein IPG41_02630 [Candidatus Peregrinibacteria bacterium]|nr:MAG: hypothetical protein IPG41_02630 [Candidatus Peregrinibacteria bacterium]